MDDLLGEDWQAPSKQSTSIPPTTLNSASYASNNYSSYRSSPVLQLSGTASPQNISRPSSALNGGAKAPIGDSFGNLLSLKSQKQASNVSIQERQRQVADEKRRQQEEQSRLWDNLGSGRGTPVDRGRSPLGFAQTTTEDVDDILAAFNKSAPVNKASHFPPPSSGSVSRGGTPALSQPLALEDDDDPFGLGTTSQARNENGPAPLSRQIYHESDDDILGDLGKPMISQPVSRTTSEPAVALEDSPPVSTALSELIEMGFTEDVAQIALAENGGDLQNAVSWLLKQAHQESRAKAESEAGERRRQPERSSSPPRRHRDEDAVPSWARQETQRQDTRSPASGERDASQLAQEFGTKFLKGANSLWKASQKQVSKTMSEFQQEREPNQPKWMQEAARASSKSRTGRKPDIDVTDEAAMLDMPRDRPSKPSRYTEQQAHDRRPAEPLPSRPSAQARFMQDALPMQDRRPLAKISRQDVEDQTAQAYISPARRRQATPKPEPQPEVDLFGSAPSPPPSKPPATTSNGTPGNPPQVRSSPIPPKPKAPPRNIPSVASSALATSAAHRKLGGEAFKRGDYASAHVSYGAALTPLPNTHPITIVVLSNRSLTALKTGDAKTAVADADRALEIIGVGQGVGEVIDLGGGEGSKDMREFYGKALMRKAEALEHLEKWTDAASVWRQAIEAGVGGAVALRSRDRCDKAAAPKSSAPKATPISKPVARAAPANRVKGPAPKNAVSSAASDEAVKKLREANAAAEKTDDEKFRLADQVDGKLTAWKAGKADNLRALLQSMDIVLWPEAGWKKVGMSDLVMPNKVKIIYMKAIAKVHPDKISQDATTEQRMISAAVFSTLNEAWDKFKKDNNL